MRSIIRLENVWKIYQKGKIPVVALKGIDLEINKGEFVAIVGPSGSGKSTMMNIIGCLDVPTRGHIYLDNKDVLLYNESELAEIRGKKIGFIFQQFNLIPTLTALENVMLPMEFQNISSYESQKKAINALALVGLKNRIDHKPSELSGGQAQRVAIARALVNDPEIILADEPTGNLDSKTGKYVIDFLYKLHKEKKKTIVIITHNPSITKSIKKIIYLKDGQIIRRVKK